MSACHRRDEQDINYGNEMPLKSRHNLFPFKLRWRWQPSLTAHWRLRSEFTNEFQNYDQIEPRFYWPTSWQLRTLKWRRPMKSRFNLTVVLNCVGEYETKSRRPRIFCFLYSTCRFIHRPFILSNGVWSAISSGTLNKFSAPPKKIGGGAKECSGGGMENSAAAAP